MGSGSKAHNEYMLAVLIGYCFLCPLSARLLESSSFLPHQKFLWKVRGGGYRHASDGWYNDTTTPTTRRNTDWWPFHVEPSSDLRPPSSFNDQKRQYYDETTPVRNLPVSNRRRLASHHHRNRLDYRDVLNCRSPQWMWSNPDLVDIDDNEQNVLDGALDTDDIRFDSSHDNINKDMPYIDYKGTLEGTKTAPHTPVVYQYYGRSRVRDNTADAIHFILLGPNVDHWKAVGQTLASRGFNAIACERVFESSSTSTRAMQHNKHDAPNLVLEIMDALKWNRAILVGCDREATLAMETAMMLAPDRVSGLILCGDLADSFKFAAESGGMDALDPFLRRILDCPFLIISNGDTPSVVSGSSAHDAVEGLNGSSERCVILGGGSAPHRLKPEQFAWILTRFVEEKFEYSVRSIRGVTDELKRVRNKVREEGEGFLRAINLPFGIDSMVSPEGRLLLGRAVAAAVFYITIMRVAFIQYGILRAGLIGIKNRYNSVDALRRNAFRAIGAFFVNYGYVPRLFKLRKDSSDDEEDIGRMDSSLSTKPSYTEEGKNEEDMEQPEGVREGQGKQAEEDAGDNVDDDNDDNNTKPLFKPFFFLDNVVT